MMYKMLRVVTIICFTAMLSACSTVKPSATSKLSSLSNDYDGKTSSDKIKRDLTRSGSVKSTSVEVYPMTGALIEARFVEESKKLGDAPDEIKRSPLLKLLKHKSNTCFSVQINSGAQDAVNLNYWGLSLQQNGKTIGCKFQDPNTSGYYETTRHFSSIYHPATKYTSAWTSVSSYDTTNYYNSNTICVRHDQVDLKQSFSLVLQPRYKEKLKPIVLTWQAPKAKENKSA